MAFAVLVLLNLTKSEDLDCFYYTNQNWKSLNTVYECKIQNQVKITSKLGAKIENHNGTHENEKSIDDVTGFWISGKIVNYFPSGLENIFRNLQGIGIYNSHLKQIVKKDLRPFPRLVNLNLAKNDIQEIVKGLFDFNPDLKYIDLKENEITRIHPKTFNNLYSLVYLYLSKNYCIDINIETDSVQFQTFIQNIKTQCPSSSGIADEINEIKEHNSKVSSALSVVFSESLDFKIGQLRNELINKVDEKIENLEKKINKILTSLKHSENDFFLNNS